MGLPGAGLSLQPEDPTIAERLKPLGYMTGQFGKNHLGDKDEFLPTLLAAAGVPDVKEKLLKGYKAGDKTFKVHLDGYNQADYLSGKSKKTARKEFFYFSDDGDLPPGGIAALTFWFPFNLSWVKPLKPLRSFHLVRSQLALPLVMR